MLRLHLKAGAPALHRVTVVLSHQRVPVVALSYTHDRDAPERADVEIELGPMTEATATQLVKRLQRQGPVLAVEEVSTQACLSPRHRLRPQTLEPPS